MMRRRQPAAVEAPLQGSEIPDADGVRRWLRAAWPRWKLLLRRSPSAASSAAFHRRGAGLELAELRPHQPGDDARRMAWGATARRGVPISKVYWADAERTTWIALDATPSLGFGAAELPWTGAGKLRAALAACGQLAASAFVRGAPCGLALLTGDFIGPPLRDEPRLFARFEQFALAACSRIGGAGPALAAVPPPLLRAVALDAPELIVVGDFLAPASFAAARSLGRRAETAVVRIVHPWERELPDHGLVRWTDAATSETRVVDTSAPRVRVAFARAAAAREAALSASFRAAGIRETVVAA